MGEIPQNLEKIRQKKVIVEIGPGGEPFPFRTKKDMGEDVYIGIERNHAKGSQNLNEIDGERPNSLIVGGDANRAPIADNSVDEIICNNIFGDAIRFPDLEKLLLEIERMLKSGGKVVITDTLTPGMMLFKLGASKKQTSEEIKQRVRSFLEKFQTKLVVTEVTFAKDKVAPIEEYVGR